MVTAHDWYVLGVSYLLPADADRLLETVQKKHEERIAQSSDVTKVQTERQQISPFVDDKHRQFIDDLVSVSACYYNTVHVDLPLVMLAVSMVQCRGAPIRHWPIIGA